MQPPHRRKKGGKGKESGRVALGMPLVGNGNETVAAAHEGLRQHDRQDEGHESEKGIVVSSEK